MKRKAVEDKITTKKITRKNENCKPLRASQHNNLPLQAHEHNFHLSKRFSNRTIYGHRWNGMAEVNKEKEPRESLEVKIINEITNFLLQPRDGQDFYRI